MSRCSDTIYCDQTWRNNISQQLENAIPGPFLVGHDYLYYVNLTKGYQVIQLDPPVNVTQYTFVSYQQTATGGRIAQYSVQFTGNIYTNYYANADMVWNDGTNKWTNLVSAKSNQYTGNKVLYSASHIRLITDAYSSSLNDFVNITVQYLSPGQFNFTALALETDQTDVVNINVTLSNIHFLSMNTYN